MTFIFKDNTFILLSCNYGLFSTPAFENFCNCYSKCKTCTALIFKANTASPLTKNDDSVYYFIAGTVLPLFKEEA